VAVVIAPLAGCRSMLHSAGRRHRQDPDRRAGEIQRLLPVALDGLRYRG
jgi:hypothetical protein